MKKISDNPKITELIKAAASGNEYAFEELSVIYKPMLSKTVASFSKKEPGDSEFDDMYQEALLAFYKAVNTYDTSMTEVTFGLYAKTCVKNAMISIYRKKRTKKKKEIQAKTKKEKPQKLPFEITDTDIANKLMSVLSPLEFQVLCLFARKTSYKKIAEELNISEKSVDNALFRIRKKLKTHSLK